jgi:hypothetical protein
MGASTIAPPMNAKPAPGEPKQVFAQDVEAEQNRSFADDMKREVAAQEKKDKEFHDQMERDAAA